MPTLDLIDYIFGTERDLLCEQFAAWLSSSNRWQAFALQHRDKIRKKVRNTRDAEQRLSLLGELETAYLLVQERRFAVEYEAFNANKTRAPDLTVRFKVNTRFNIEVAHLHSTASSPTDATAKLYNAICAKLGQLQPAMPNVLLVVAAPPLLQLIDGAAAIRYLFERASQRDDSFFERRGLTDVRTFHAHMLRLSGVLGRSLLLAEQTLTPAFWGNPQTRQPLSAELHNALLRAFTQ